MDSSTFQVQNSKLGTVSLLVLMGLSEIQYKPCMPLTKGPSSTSSQQITTIPGPESSEYHSYGLLWIYPLPYQPRQVQPYSQSRAQPLLQAESLPSVTASTAKAAGVSSVHYSTVAEASCWALELGRTGHGVHSSTCQAEGPASCCPSHLYETSPKSTWSNKCNYAYYALGMQHVLSIMSTAN